MFTAWPGLGVSEAPLQGQKNESADDILFCVLQLLVNEFIVNWHKDEIARLLLCQWNKS